MPLESTHVLTVEKAKSLVKAPSAKRTHALVTKKGSAPRLRALKNKKPRSSKKSKKIKRKKDIF